MIEATPSITKNAMSTKVSERTPLNGHNRSTIPTAIPRIAETSDHQKPGALAHPEGGDQTDDSADEKEPANRISTASVAMGGITMAARPRMTRIIPSFSP